MTLQQLFDDCFTVIFKESGMSNNQIENLKHDLVYAWIRNTSRRIDTLLTKEERQKIQELIANAEKQEVLAHAKLDKLFLPVVTELERYNDIMTIVFAEARVLIEKLFKVFCDTASNDQLFRVKEVLGKYERVLHLASN